VFSVNLNSGNLDGLWLSGDGPSLLAVDLEAQLYGIADVVQGLLPRVAAGTAPWQGRGIGTERTALLVPPDDYGVLHSFTSEIIILLDAQPRIRDDAQDCELVDVSPPAPGHCQGHSGP
jgi:hypothetical protein